MENVLFFLVEAKALGYFLPNTLLVAVRSDDDEESTIKFNERINYIYNEVNVAMPSLIRSAYPEGTENVFDRIMW